MACAAIGIIDANGLVVAVGIWRRPAALTKFILVSGLNSQDESWPPPS